MKSSMMMIATAACTCAFASAPEVTVTDTVQSSTRAVKVNYTIAGEPAVVTPYVETNRGDGVWIDIGAENVTYCTGDMNKFVSVGDHEFVWQADKSWPNHKITDGNIRVGVKAWATNAPPDYMVADLDQQNVIRYYASVGQLPGGLSDKQYRTRKLVMRKIPAAGVTWLMGLNKAERDRDGLKGNLVVQGEVTFTQDYYMAVYQLTAFQYWMITGKCEPSNRSLEALTAWGEPISETPAQKIDWLCARSILNSSADNYKWPAQGHDVGSGSLLGYLRTKSGVEFDLPTDAQWEYAYRAGEADLYCLGGACTAEKVNRIAWSDSNGTKEIGGVSVLCRTHPVGQLLPNNWGLYDMAGNGREWTLDYFTEDANQMFGTDPTGPTATSNYRTLRGGVTDTDPWNYVVWGRQSKARNSANEQETVRVACPAIVPSTAK